ncbi:hypothetical protein [Streptomyces bacillaris]|uniref:hypothetical protein n=1 Tax=Streptomyces bacillaris TaxID=68179 RepID=UPI00381465CB
MATSLYNASLAAELATMKRRLAALERSPKNGGRADRCLAVSRSQATGSAVLFKTEEDLLHVSLVGINNPVVVIDAPVVMTSAGTVTIRPVPGAGSAPGALTASVKKGHTRARWVWRWPGRVGWQAGTGATYFTLKAKNSVDAQFGDKVFDPVIQAISEADAEALGQAVNTVRVS